MRNAECEIIILKFEVRSTYYFLPTTLLLPLSLESYAIVIGSIYLSLSLSILLDYCSLLDRDTERNSTYIVSMYVPILVYIWIWSVILIQSGVSMMRVWSWRLYVLFNLDGIDFHSLLSCGEKGASKHWCVRNFVLCV
jgi:hypothetical protein